MVPINWPLAALKRVSVAVGLVLVASTLRLRFLTTNSAFVILTESTVFGTVIVWVAVTPPKVAENVTGVSTPTGASGTLSDEKRKSPGWVSAGIVKLAGIGATAGLLLARRIVSAAAFSRFSNKSSW